ncbi:MAG TPA: hypothetical protein VM658_00440 [bacterium]|nr:hypothetical protein [bacterium]
MTDYIPWSKRLDKEFDAFIELFIRRRWRAIIFIILLIGVAIYFAYNQCYQYKTISKLENDNTDLQSRNRDLERDIRQVESENKGLRETVAPLIARASREFPGEEINISLKKIVDRLESIDPLRQDIISATATVFLTIKSDTDRHFPDKDNALYVSLINGNTVLLKASTYEYIADKAENGLVKFTIPLTMSQEDPAIGKPIDSLRQAQQLQVYFGSKTEVSFVTDGKAIFLINNSIRLEFTIPPQQINDSKIYVRDLSEGFKSLFNTK